MVMVFASITILIAGQPIATWQGYVDAKACSHPPHLPRMEDSEHRPITYRIECQAR